MDEVPAEATALSAGSPHCATRPRARASTTPSARSASSVAACTAARAEASSCGAGASGPTSPSISAPITAGAASRVSCSGNRRPSMAALMRFSSSAASARRKSSRSASIVALDRLGDHRPGQPPRIERARGQAGDRRRQARRAAPARHRAAARMGGELAACHRARSVRRSGRSWRGNSGRRCPPRYRRVRPPPPPAPPPCRPRARAPWRPRGWRARARRAAGPRSRCGDRA